MEKFTAEQLEQRMKNVERLRNFYRICQDTNATDKSRAYYQRLIDRCNDDYKNLRDRLKKVKA